MKFAPEGYPFIFGSLAVTVVVSTVLFWFSRTGSQPFSFYLFLCTSCFLTLITFFMAYFFRDPERQIPAGNDFFVSPADGKIILIRDVYEKEHLKSEVKQVSIFMSPLNVHVNRAPCDGKVITVKYSPGKFMAAYRDDASMKNENIVMVLDGKQGNVMVRQVAGFVARRAVCRSKVGDFLRRGDRYGIIKFSSRLDLYLPRDAEVKVKIGDNVKAGESVIAVGH